MTNHADDRIGRFGLGFCLALAASILMTGCSDYRITLDEFQSLQEQRKAEAVETAAGADDVALGELLDRQLAPYTVGPSDVLLVTLTGPDPDVLPPPFQVRVNHEGAVMLPIAGSLSLSGMELIDAEAAIQAVYVPGYVKDVAVHVELVTEGNVEVLVVGAVTEPGLVPLGRRQRNLMHAIVGAGGVSEAASGKATLKRIRKPAETIELDLTDPEGIRQALALAPLESGDIISVSAATPNMVFIGGLVNMPRPQEYAPGVKMTVLQALAAAGGLRTDVYPKEATLVRRMPDGSDVQVKLDLDRLYAGQDKNIELAAGDILWVPHTAATRIQDFINRNIFLRAGISVNYSVTGREYLNRPSAQSGGRSGGGILQDAFDPFGFLSRNSGLQTLVDRPPIP